MQGAWSKIEENRFASIKLAPSLFFAPIFPQSSHSIARSDGRGAMQRGWNEARGAVGTPEPHPAPRHWSGCWVLFERIDTPHPPECMVTHVSAHQQTKSHQTPLSPRPLGVLLTSSIRLIKKRKEFSAALSIHFHAHLPPPCTTHSNVAVFDPVLINTLNHVCSQTWNQL